MSEAIKENVNKVSYREIPVEFIYLLAQRMSHNKDKYPPFNWQKNIDPMLLIDSVKRHLADLELSLKDKVPLHNPGEGVLDHIAAIGCNMFMLHHRMTN